MRNSISKSNLAEIAQALREARIAKRLSQRALSARSGATQAQISRIENGEVDLQVSSLIELARALDMDLVLAPRRSLPAVEAVVREGNSAFVYGMLDALKFYDERLGGDPTKIQPVEHAQARHALETIETLANDGAAVSAVKNARALLNGIIHGGQLPGPYERLNIRLALKNVFMNFDRAKAEQSPAYTLDNEGDDEEDA